MKTLKNTFVTLVVLGLLSGCAGQKSITLPNGDEFNVATISGFNHAHSYAGVYRQQDDGSKKEIAGDLYKSQSTAGQMAVAGTGALLNGAGGELIRTFGPNGGRCGGGGCPSGGNNYITAVAESVSDAATETIVESALNVGAGCGTACVKP